MNKIKKLRQELGLSREEFSKAIGKTKSCISNYENNLRNPEIDIAYKIIEVANSHGKTKTLEDIYPPPNKPQSINGKH